MTGKPDPNAYIKLARHALVRRLECPSLYDRDADELYELNEEGFEGLLRCDGSRTLAEAKLEDDFVADCVEAGLLELHEEPSPRELKVGGFSSAGEGAPSLRYLELQITRRCNLACHTCYLGNAQPVDMSPEEVARVTAEFERIGGLRLLVSGGEPLAHPRWDEVNRVLSGLEVRRVLLSNGLLLDDEALANLACHEVQLSIDGMARGHEMIRGTGTFEAVVEAAHRVSRAGLELSVATMAHAGNLGELDELEELVTGLGAREWSIDAPCAVGRLAGHPELAITLEEAGAAMRHGFGGAYHGGSEGMACGLHLATVGADGTIAQCGFYFDRPLGTVEGGLENAWLKRRPVAIAEIAGCPECEAVEDCGGGCRFRAASPCEPDRVMCAVFGVGGRSAP